MDPLRTRFVLVQPQSAGNVGSAARALKNLGFERLLLVRPACDPRGPEARRLAVEAHDVLRDARVCSSLDDALEGAGSVVGLTRRTGRQRCPHWRLDALICPTEKPAPLDRDVETAWVFGREDHGLSDAELDCCTHLAFLPASEQYPSLNLAQAVLVVAWELRRTALGSSDASAGLAPPAGHGSREAMYRHLERALLAIGYLQPTTAESMMRRLRRMLGRAGLTEEEVVILRGVARQALWSAERARAGEDEQGPGREPDAP